MTETFGITEFDGFVGQQAQCPTAVAFGGVGAGEQSQTRFEFAGHFTRRSRPHRFVGERRLHPFGKETATNIANREAVAAENAGDFGVCSRGVLRPVEQQQNAGSCLLTRRMLSGANDAFELRALVGCEGKGSMLCHTTILPALPNL